MSQTERIFKTPDEERLVNNKGTTSALLMIMFLGLSLQLGCMDSPQPSAAEEEPAPQTQRQAQTSAQGPNWFAAGGTYTDLLGEDGEPDALAGRLVNNGVGVSCATPNKNGWLIAGPTGLTSLLDEDGKPKFGDLRTVIEGRDVLALSMGTIVDDQGTELEEFLSGGKAGWIQRLDENGQPRELKAQLFANGADVTAIAYYKGARQWLVGAADGQLQVVDKDLGRAAAAAPFASPITAAVGSTIDNAQKRWLMISGEEFSYYPNPMPTTLEQGATLTALGRSADNKVAIGTMNGRVAIFDFDAVGAAPTWITVLGGAQVIGLVHNGSQWLALGKGGMAQLIDAQGQAVGQARKITTNTEISGAAWYKDRWLVATHSSYILDLKPDLTPNYNYPQPLEGAQIYDADASAAGIVVVGEQGRYRLISERGQPQGATKTVGSGVTLKAASWSGSSYLIGGEQGKAQLLNAAGEPEGQEMTLLDGADIETISWNGTQWLVAGAQGKIQRLRSDATLVDGAARQVEGFDHIYGARWSGREWMVVGVKDNQAAFRLVQQDGSPKSNAYKLQNIPGPFYAVEWTGREWFMGGHQGLIQIASAEGAPREVPMPMPRDVLDGADIYSMDYHQGQVLVGGQGGLVSKLSDSLQGNARAASILGFADVRALRWSKPRGFSGGECLNSESCYNGPCIGGSIQTGFCCDSVCDKPCESCQGELTGQPDGQCSPILADKRPVNPAGCPRATETSCGLTGLCDGQGECQFYDTTISCQAPSCTAGEVSPEAFCDGAGSCATPAVSSCAPYTICDGIDCATSCTSTNDCAEGYRCTNSVCELIPTAQPKPKEEEGCAVSGTSTPSQSPWGLGLLGLLGLGLRRARRKRSI